MLIVIINLCCRQAERPADTNGGTAAKETAASGTAVGKPRNLAEIKLRYAQIVQQLEHQRLDSAVRKYDCHGERGGKIIYFTENEKLVLIRHQYHEYSHYEAIDDYFIADDQLFFANLTGTSWSFETGNAAEAATRDQVLEQRIYLVNDKPLQCLEKKYIISSTAKNPVKPAEVANVKVNCKPVQPLLLKYRRLLAFKNENQDCLD